MAAGRTLSGARHSTTATPPPARGSCPSPAGRCRCSTPGIREEHSPCARRRRVRRLAHGRDRDARARRRPALLQRLLSNDVAQLAEGGAQYSVLCREDGGVLDDLFTYRLARRPLPDRHQRRQPRAGPRLVPRPRRRASTPSSTTASTTSRCSPCRARGARARRRLADGELPPGSHRRAERRRRALLVCGTGYTGEDGVELLLAPRRRPRCLGRPVEAGVTPVGLGARDTLRLEVCFHLYGNDLSRPRPDRGRPRLVLQGGDGLRRRRGCRRRARARAPREARAFTLTGPGIARQGNAVLGGGIVTSGTLSPSLGVGIGWPTCRPTRPSPAPRSRSTFAAASRARVVE